VNAPTGQRRPGPARRLAWVVVTVLLGAALGVGSQVIAPSPAMACHSPDHGWVDSNGNWHCDGDVEIPPDTPDPTGPPPDEDDQDDPPAPACPDWVLLGGYDSVPAHLRPYSWDDAPEGSTFYFDACTSPATGMFAPGVTTMWLPPGEELVPPAPEEVADGLWVQISATLLRPELVTSPEVGERALVEVPTFVAVSNWQGEVSESQCELGVCVSLTATPELHFDPGEPGSEVIVCDPPGTYFDPDGAEPDEQAAVDGACAHPYQRRSGVAGRPSSWPGEVSVVWTAVWQATAGGTGTGEFELTLSTDLPRPVREAPTVVVDDD
jgi:hypothetical protein